MIDKLPAVYYEGRIGEVAEDLSRCFQCREGKRDADALANYMAWLEEKQTAAQRREKKVATTASSPTE